jgi:predicted P-loop ATPase|nr:MAG TPA: virulence associated protein E [Caudoviricetes sp.]
MNQIRYDGSVTIAVGESRRSTQWKNKEVLWSQLVERLSIPTKTPETVDEYRGFAKSKRDEIKDVGGFVGGSLKGGRRKAEAIMQRRLLTLDLDDVPRNADPWDTVVLVLGCAAVLYSTHSHRPEAPRLRLVMPLSRPVSPEEYSAIARKVAQDIGIDMCDDTTYEPHRLMYWPSASINAEYRYEVEDGPWLNADEQLARYVDWHDPSEWPISSRRAEALHRLASHQESPLEKSGIVGAFCRVYDIHDAIEHFLPDTYEKYDDNRYTYKGGSTSGGLVLYDNGVFAYSHHGTDPASGKLCNAFDLVRIHLYGNLDDDTSPGTPSHKMPSFMKLQDEAMQIPEVREELAKANFERLKDRFDDPDEDYDWVGQLTCNKNGKFDNTINNVQLIMEHDAGLRGKYFYDTFKERMTVCGDLPWCKLADRMTTTWTDTDDAGLRNFLEIKYEIVNTMKIGDAVLLAMQSCMRHPVREYLLSLKWDGVARADTIFIDYLGAEDTEYTRTVTRKALIGAVARIMQPGCKHDHILVLVGPQGCRKSTTLAKLGKSWFSDSFYTVQGKEAYEQIQGFWLIEMGEMAATRKAELESIKQFVSKQSDSYRAAYAKRTQEHPRQCAFFGTTNDDEFLRDATGGRRFWPVTVTDKGRETGDYFTAEIVDQVWAEIVMRYSAGENWYLDNAKIEAVARQIQDAHTEMNGKQGLLEQFVERLLPKDWATRNLSQRLAYWNDGFDDEKQAGTERRKAICALEIHCELFGGTVKDYTPQKTREYNAMLKRLPGWKARSRINYGEIYGQQRGFVREETE